MIAHAAVMLFSAWTFVNNSYSDRTNTLALTEQGTLGVYSRSA